MPNARNPLSDQTAFSPVRHLVGCGPTARWLATALSAPAFALPFPAQLGHAAEPPARKTAVTIVGDTFHINGQPTYPD